MGVTSIGGHTRPDCNARYDVRIKLVETWLFVCLTWRGNVGRLFVMVLHVVLTPMKSWTLIGREWINSARVWNTRFWLAVWWSNQYYYLRSINLSIYLCCIYFRLLLLFFRLRRKVVEFFWARFLPRFPLFFPVSRGFFVGVFPGLQVSLVDTYPKLR